MRVCIRLLHGGGISSVAHVSPLGTHSLGDDLTVDHRELHSVLQMDPKFLRNQVRVESYLRVYLCVYVCVFFFFSWILIGHELHDGVTLPGGRSLFNTRIG